MDYFVVGEHFLCGGGARSPGEEAFSEQLVRLPGTAAVLFRPVAAALDDRSRGARLRSMGVPVLSDAAPVFFCPQVCCAVGVRARARASPPPPPPMRR